MWLCCVSFCIIILTLKDLCNETSINGKKKFGDLRMYCFLNESHHQYILASIKFMKDAYSIQQKRYNTNKDIQLI
jgi:hypothetical protein